MKHSVSLYWSHLMATPFIFTFVLLWGVVTSGSVMAQMEIMGDLDREDNRTIGRVVAWRNGKVSTQIPGLINSLPVREGERIKKGQTLAVLATASLKLDIAQAQAEMEAAQALVDVARAQKKLKENVFNRQRRLRRSASFQSSKFEEAKLLSDIASAQLISAELQVSVKRAILERRKLDVELSTIKAPYNGIISQVYKQVGTYVPLDDAHIFEIVDDTSLEIEMDMSADKTVSLGKDSIIIFQIEGGKAFKARLRAILPNVNMRTQTRSVRFTPLDPDSIKYLAIGQNVNVFFPKSG